LLIEPRFRVVFGRLLDLLMAAERRVSNGATEGGLSVGVPLHTSYTP
jgi:hypothetical protein